MRTLLETVQRLHQTERFTSVEPESAKRLLELAWRCEAQETFSLEEIDDAEEIAEQINDRGLLAHLLRERALILLYSDSRSAAVQAMREAHMLAQAAGDLVLEWKLLAELGHALVGEDLVGGLALQHQAHAMYTAQLVPTCSETPQVQAALHVLSARIGVNEFDMGDYDAATHWLTQSVAGMHQLDMQADLPWALNYLVQVYIAIGRFEDAETLLNEAIALQEDSPPDPFKANNLALLGKLYLEWERVQDAGEPLRRGWAESLATRNVALLSLVRNYYAELLMYPAYESRDLAAAEEQLLRNLEETRASAFHRSEIQALALYAQLALMQGDAVNALARSTQAIEYLDRMGTLPALRTEEILWTHACALHAVERHADAQVFVDRARAIFQQKASTIADPEQRRVFYERVPLNRLIRTQAMARGDRQ